MQDKPLQTLEWVNLYVTHTCTTWQYYSVPVQDNISMQHAICFPFILRSPVPACPLLVFFFLFFSSSSSSLLPLLAVTKRLVDVWLSVCIYVRTSLRTHASGKKKSRHSIPHDPSTPAPAQIFPCQQQERIKNNSRETFFQWNVRLSPWSPRISANNYKKNAKGTAIVETTVLNLPWKGKPSNQQQQPNTRDEM